jgi:hypothetical protein
MKIFPVALMTIGLGISVSHAADESEIAAGKALNDQHCVACHGPELYTRKNRIVNSKPSLFTQVQRCETNLKLQWFDEESQNVTEYLNQEHYRFK